MLPTRPAGTEGLSEEELQRRIARVSEHDDAVARGPMVGAPDVDRLAGGIEQFEPFAVAVGYRGRVWHYFGDQQVAYQCCVAAVMAE